MTDKEIKEKVNAILKQMEETFHKVEPSLMHGMHRDEYFEKHPELDNEQKLNFPFSLSANDIIDKKIPWLVAGCTGCSRLFSKYARDIGLNDFFVVLTAKKEHLEQYAKGQLRGQIHGHQVIAIQMSDGLHILDVQHGLGKTFEQIEVKAQCKVDESVDFQRHKGFIISAILTPEQYDKTNSYNKIKDAYLSCNTAKKLLLNQATKEMNKKTNNHINYNEFVSKDLDYE